MTEKQRKTAKLQLRLSPESLKIAKERAKAAKMSVSRWLLAGRGLV